MRPRRHRPHTCDGERDLESRLRSGLLRQHATERPEKVAFRAEAATVTFAELDAATRRFAAGLAGSGVGRGDRVVICLPAGLDAAGVAVPGIRVG